MANNPQSSGPQPLRPPVIGSIASHSFGPALSVHFRPPLLDQHGHSFISVGAQQCRPAGQGISSSNAGLPSLQSQQLQFSQQMQLAPPRPVQPLMSFIQSNRPFTSDSNQIQQTPLTNHMPFSGPGMAISSSYTYAPISFPQQQNNANQSSQFSSVSQIHTPVIPVGGQPWMSSASQATVMQQSGGQQPAISATNVPSPTQQSSSDWQEHASTDGRRYYYNKKTKQSSWEKPLELMTPIERADASTVWKEFTSDDGRKYFYNKVTKHSIWTMPEELKLAREQAEKAFSTEAKGEIASVPLAPMSAAVSVETPSTAAAADLSIAISTTSGVTSSPFSVTPVVTAADLPVVMSSGSSDPSAPSPVRSFTGGHPVAGLTPIPSAVSVVGVSSLLDSSTSLNNYDKFASHVSGSLDGASIQDIEEAKKGMAVAGKVNVTPLEEKTVDDEPFAYPSKLEAKNAFKALLESSNVESDWTWDQAMRVIINDKRYGALKTLGERKQAFNEYLGQRRKVEVEERRMRHKKAREDFIKMLEESKELTSSTRWSKAVTMFEDDERFKAIERSRDREELFHSYLDELQGKEKYKAKEEFQRNRIEYRKFLESCDFIKVNSQWRKVQDRLEDDDRFSRLEKIERLEIFQEYIRDLEKEEEEQKKLQKDQLRRTERKNRDEFRKMMEGHAVSGILTAKINWRDYCMKVKDLPQYLAVASNTSGSTPKDLFEDVAEELEKQFHDDKTRIKDAMKIGKVIITPLSTFEAFKASLLEDIGSPSISDVNMKLVFEEVLDRVREREEKEAKKRQRLADEFISLLRFSKEITASSEWEDCKLIFEDCEEFSSIGDENFGRQIFEEYIAHLQEKAKEKERKREEEKVKKDKEREEKDKKKEKDKKEREREREKGKERSKKDETESENIDVSESYEYREEKRREKDKDRKYRKRHQSFPDEVYSDDDEREDSRRSRRHGSGSDRKKSRKAVHTPESESENRHKRQHKREYREISRRNGTYEELEDGELGEDGEIPV